MVSFLIIIADNEVRSKLEEIYHIYRKDMFTVSYSILKDYQEAEDVVQDTVIKLAKLIDVDKIGEIKCKKTRCLIVTIVRNRSFNIYKKSSKVIQVENGEFDRMGCDRELLVEDHMIQLEKSKEIAKQMSRLKPSYADVLTLRYFYEMTIVEIADLIGIEESNVYTRLSRARMIMKKILEEGGVDHE